MNDDDPTHGNPAHLAIDGLVLDQGTEAAKPSILSIARSQTQGSPPHPRFLASGQLDVGPPLGMTGRVANVIPDMLGAAPILDLDMT